MCSYAHHVLQSPQLSIHLEPCALHGVAITKTRAAVMKTAAAALCSFTRWLRVERNMGALTTQIVRIVSDAVEVRREPRPLDAVSKGAMLIDVLYAGSDSLYLWHGRRGQTVRSSLLEDLQRLFSVVDVDTSDQWIVGGFVSEDSDAHLVEGRPVGSRLFESGEAGVEAVVVAVLSFVTGRS
jgi:hypothetical protein